MIDSKHKAILVNILEMASEELGNNGCNDFYLAAFLPKVEDRRALMKEVYEDNGDPENFDPNGKYTYVTDFMLASFFARKISKSA